MLAIAIFGVFWWLMRPTRDWFGGGVALEINAGLRRVSAHLRSGSNDPRPPDGPMLPVDLAHEVEQASLSGLEVLESLRAFEVEIQSSANLAGQSLALARLFWTRGALLGCVAVAAEIWSKSRGMIHMNLHVQILSGLFAGAVYASSMHGLRLGMGHTWLLKVIPANTSPARWLATHISGECSHGSPWAAAIDQVSEREWSQGISLQREKRMILEEWSRERLAVSSRRLGLATDLMPVLELVGLGLPLLLLTYKAVTAVT